MEGYGPLRVETFIRQVSTDKLVLSAQTFLASALRGEGLSLNESADNAEVKSNLRQSQAGRPDERSPDSRQASPIIFSALFDKHANAVGIRGWSTHGQESTVEIPVKEKRK